MLNELKTIEEKALALPAVRRAALAQHLLATLDDVNEQENELLWMEEALRRYQAYKAGRVSSRDAFEAIAEIREQL